MTDRVAATGMAYVRQFGEFLFSPGSLFSVWSLASALIVAVAVLALQRRAGKQLPRARVWLRVLFPRRIIASASMKADLGLFLLNQSAAGALLGWALLAATQVGAVTRTALAATLGTPTATHLPGATVAVIATGALFLAYEVAYWLDHYTSHKIPFFWAFHKAHHTADVLTPLTAFRVHPVDSLKFGNISAVVIGATLGVLAWTFGGSAQGYAVNGTNTVLLVFIYLMVHLQHSHFWIAATGAWGRILMSPAHHQIHHSDNPRHFDRNFGSTLAVWDWLAGTLYTPGVKREPIRFGVGAAVHRPHSVTGTLITPFVEAASSLWMKEEDLVRTPEINRREAL
jgi:sterol desaturase/sphingolipid hydroxylase (fatty acid hydroxylase superfamily)